MHTRINERVSYGRDVEKIECANHMTSGVNNKLHKLASNTSYPIQLRKLLLSTHEGPSRIERLVRGIRTAIKNAAQNNSSVSELRHDLSNAPNHVFGCHTECR